VVLETGFGGGGVGASVVYEMPIIKVSLIASLPYIPHSSHRCAARLLIPRIECAVLAQIRCRNIPCAQSIDLA
jgi:hypothetical protein